MIEIKNTDTKITEPKPYYILDSSGLCVNAILARAPSPIFLKPGESYAPTIEGGGIGFTWTGTEWIAPPPPSPPELTTEQKAEQIRSQRISLLAASDWTQGKDIPDTISQPWAVYRQQLRDITDQAGFPDTVTWPTKPVIS